MAAKPEVVVTSTCARLYSDLTLSKRLKKINMDMFNYLLGPGIIITVKSWYLAYLKIKNGPFKTGSSCISATVQDISKIPTASL